MRSPPPVPPLREDVGVKRLQSPSGPRFVVEDPVRRIRLPIDALTLALVEELASDAAMTQDQLAEAIGAPRVELQRRVRWLARQSLLETPRAADQLRVHLAGVEEPGDAAGDDTLVTATADAAAFDPATVTLRYPEGLRHGCVACGACCHGTDVGPLKPDDIARVRAIDWTPHLPADVRPDDWMQAVALPTAAGEQTITLMGQRHGRCVFLGADKLCVIHKVAGMAQKPTICRQFPYTFTRTGTGIDVSFSMECRKWWTAKQHGRPVAEDEAGIRRLIAEGGPVLALPNPVPLSDGLDATADEWLAIRESMVANLFGVQTISGLVGAVVDPVREAVASRMDGYRESEVFAEREAWGVLAAEPEDQVAGFFDRCGALREAIADGIDQIADAEDARGRAAEADRARRFAWAFQALLAGRRADDPLRFEHELELWRDMALAACYAHEPVRRGGLVLGTATLAMRLLVGPLLAGMLAEASLRGRISEQDATDALVLVTKVPRGTAYEQLIARHRKAWVETFFHGAGALACGAAPGAVPDWLL